MSLKQAREILSQVHWKALKLWSFWGVLDQRWESSEASEQARPAEPPDPFRAVHRLLGDTKELPPLGITSPEDTGQTYLRE